MKSQVHMLSSQHITLTCCVLPFNREGHCTLFKAIQFLHYNTRLHISQYWTQLTYEFVFHRATNRGKKNTITEMVYNYHLSPQKTFLKLCTRITQALTHCSRMIRKISMQWETSEFDLQFCLNRFIRQPQANFHHIHETDLSAITAYGLAINR